MNNYTQRVLLYKKSDNGWVSTPIVLDELGKSLKVRVGTGQSKDTFGFTVNNGKKKLFQYAISTDGLETSFSYAWGLDDNLNYSVWYEGNQISIYNYVITHGLITFINGYTPPSGEIVVKFNVVEQDDYVVIYQKIGDAAWADTDVSLEGVVENVDAMFSDGDNQVSVSGDGAISSVFGILAFSLQTYDGGVSVKKSVTDLIKEEGGLLDFVNNLLQGTKTILWDENNDVCTVEIDYASKYKRAIEILHDYSNKNINGEGYYYFYLRRAGTVLGVPTFYLVWKKKDLVTDISYITEGVGDYYDLTTSYTPEEWNGAIMQLGSDAYGQGKEELFIDTTKGLSGSPKWKYMTETGSILSELLDEQFTVNSSQFEVDDDGNRVSTFPEGSELSSGYKMTFTDESGADIVVTTENAYNAALVTQAVLKGKEFALKYLEGHGDKKAVTIYKNFDSINEFPLGSLVNFNYSSLGWTNLLLRVEKVEYGVSYTKLFLQQDELMTGAEL